MRLCAIVLAACGHPSQETTGPDTRFESPLLGRPLHELFYGAYLDQGGRDYNCGFKFYAGHAGTDILLRNFRVQDSGVTVVAAAPGQVRARRDGQPDRHSVANPANLWNYVEIGHEDGYSSIYGHLRNGSVVVEVGQSVAAGTPLGQVGSSGFSNWPHLHFQVMNERRKVVDPWAGGCATTRSLWKTQLTYQNEFEVLDLGILDRPVDGAGDLAERPADSPTVTGVHGVLSAWIELYNVRADALEVGLLDPSGEPANSVSHPQVLTFSITYALVTFPLPPGAAPGKWTVVFTMRPLGASQFEEIGRKDFTLAPIAAVLPGFRIATRPTLQLFTVGIPTH